MADRDALIVICWLVILILVFFECFHRKLKARFGGDIRPPSSTRQTSTSFPLDSLSGGEPGSFSGPHFGGNYRRGDLLVPSLGHSMMSHNRSTRFTGPIAITTSCTAANDVVGRTKEVCRIPMMSYDSVEDEEPPPTYEEAISYAKLMSKFQSSLPYEDRNGIVRCADDDTIVCDSTTTGTATCNGSFSSANCNGISVTRSSNSGNATNHVIPTTSTERTTTTAIFVSEEESDDEEDDAEDDDSSSSSSQSANESEEDEQSSLDVDSNNNNDNLENERDPDSKSVLSRSVNNISKIEQSTEVQCNMNVILTSSSSTSKNLDKIEIQCGEKIRMKGDCKKSSEREINNLQYSPPSPPPKLLPPPSPGNIV